MEVTCNRCHQIVQAESCYCPACGLPQLVYAADNATSSPHGENWPEAVRDASSIDWKPGMRAAIALAVPAGLLASGISPLSVLGMFWMAAAAAWAVVLYIRSQRPAWITIGAGARIGLVTGLLAGWLAFAVSGGWLFAQRTVLHQASQIDGVYKSFVDTFEQKKKDMSAGMSAPDAAQVQASMAQIESFILSPEGHAGIWVFSLVFNSVFLVLFAVGGGALGARLLARSRRPEI
jgi:hypothetical protein